MAKSRNAGTDVEQVTVEAVELASDYSREELAGINSFDDAIRLAQAKYGTVRNAQDLGDGFRLAEKEDKFRLCGVPLMLLEWTFRDGDYGDMYVSIHAVAQEASGAISKWIINDGSTGINKQLQEYQGETGMPGGLMVRGGLRASEYDTDLESGEPITKKEAARRQSQGIKTGRGCTFYLATNA